MADNSNQYNGREAVFLFSVNVLINGLSSVLYEYRQADLSFAQSTGSKGGATVADINRKLAHYQSQLNEIMDKLEAKSEDLQRVRVRLKYNRNQK